LLLSLPACKGNGHESHEAHEVPVTKQPATSLAAGIAAAQKSEPGLKFLAAEIGRWKLVIETGKITAE